MAWAGIAALSMNVFLPSRPAMARYFGVEYGLMQLWVSACLGASAVVQLLVGPISDRWGRRPVMLGALAIFLAATAGTLLAPTAGWLLAMRMIQAVVTTGPVLSRAVVRDMVSGPAVASRIGCVTMGMAVVPMLPPVLGGALDQFWGWKASFTATLALRAFFAYLDGAPFVGETVFRLTPAEVGYWFAAPRSAICWATSLQAAGRSTSAWTG